jgi:hypothetical protein
MMVEDRFEALGLDAEFGRMTLEQVEGECGLRPWSLLLATILPPFLFLMRLPCLDDAFLFHLLTQI